MKTLEFWIPEHLQTLEDTVTTATTDMGPILAWQPLPLELIKLNFDAALINNEAAIAVVARNDRGELLMA